MHSRDLPYQTDLMTRTQVIALITAKLALLDDERVMAVADIVQDMAQPSPVPLDLSDVEHAAIQRSKEDFKQGRTYSNDEYHAEMAMFIADLKSKHQ